MSFRMDLSCLVCKAQYGPTDAEDAKRFIAKHDHTHYQHTLDEPRDQQRGEKYTDWLRRTLSFARTYGGVNADGSWTCGYCVVDRHEDCIVDCGCPDPRCQPHSSGNTGAGIHDFG